MSLDAGDPLFHAKTGAVVPALLPEIRLPAAVPLPAPPVARGAGLG